MRKIVVVPHENHWSEKFQMEAKRLKSAMPETVKIHHIGSTSVPTGGLNLLLIRYGSRKYRKSRWVE